MNAFKFRIGNKDSLDKRKTIWDTRRPPIWLTRYDQTLISMIMLMNIHIWICLV